MTAPENIYEIEIAATPERIWDAITDPQQTRQYFYGALSKSDWRVGSRWTSESEEGEVYLDGEILEIDPPRRLSTPSASSRIQPRRPRRRRPSSGGSPPSETSAG